MFIFSLLGYYSDSSGSTSCTKCSAGDDCSNPSVTPTPCPTGTYSDEGDSGCTSCAIGQLSLQTPL